MLQCRGKVSDLYLADVSHRIDFAWTWVCKLCSTGLVTLTLRSFSSGEESVVFRLTTMSQWELRTKANMSSPPRPSISQALLTLYSANSVTSTPSTRTSMTESLDHSLVTATKFTSKLKMKPILMLRLPPHNNNKRRRETHSRTHLPRIPTRALCIEVLSRRIVSYTLSWRSKTIVRLLLTAPSDWLKNTKLSAMSPSEAYKVNNASNLATTRISETCKMKIKRNCCWETMPFSNLTSSMKFHLISQLACGAARRTLQAKLP